MALMVVAIAAVLIRPAAPAAPAAPARARRYGSAKPRARRISVSRASILGVALVARGRSPAHAARRARAGGRSAPRASCPAPPPPARTTGAQITRVGHRPRLALVGEGQHVGRVVLAAVVAVERAAFVGVDEADRRSAGAIERGRASSARPVARSAPVRAASANCSDRESCTPDGSPRGDALCRHSRRLARALVGVDDARTSGWRTTSAVVKRVKAMPRTPSQHALGVDQAALLPLRRSIWRDVAGDDGLGAEADAGEEHLHLLGRRVLRLVEDDEGVVERAPAHEGERRDLDGAALEALRRPCRSPSGRRARRRAGAGRDRPSAPGRRAGSRAARPPRRPGASARCA